MNRLIETHISIETNFTYPAYKKLSSSYKKPKFGWKKKERKKSRGHVNKKG